MHEALILIIWDILCITLPFFFIKLLYSSYYSMYLFTSRMDSSVVATGSTLNMEYHSIYQITW